MRAHLERSHKPQAQAAVSQGGTTSDSFSGGAGGDATGGGGDQGLLPIISRRLSRRGGIEVDGRSNTLIITDVKENIDAVRQLIALLDQPEPQVEIETRIVIASRNFSRDLGVQLSAIALNPSRGGSINAGTTGALAAAANTVIGLTTGIFGTAQITASITAGEQQGQAKIIANPRVTALNNRPAQIETGSQIPVTTVQPGGTQGGAVILTTTFVSVPLRLSVTPQISDAGTVLMRVVAENNSIDPSLRGAAGVPGISTQRLQTEVLVPDGGTTVIGGALNDNEANGQTRTPGLGNLPVIGNLFKRRTTDRTTSEILFFITPRIYRPDYQGNQIAAGAPATSTRSVQIAQPVPLGNPSSNTPTPTQLQQQQPQIGPQSQGSPTTINAPNTAAPSTTVVPGARP
jgi:type IV pilus assembly protein PilQ